MYPVQACAVAHPAEIRGNVTAMCSPDFQNLTTTTTAEVVKVHVHRESVQAIALAASNPWQKDTYTSEVHVKIGTEDRGLYRHADGLAYSVLQFYILLLHFLHKY